MKPPMCALCYKEFLDTDEGGLVYFEKRSSDERWISVMKEEGMQGHPPFAEWFCAEHYEAAIELKKLTIDEAMNILKEKYPMK
ncbi:MAG: hypothetical protein KGD64_01485 [Candidatus Heimdallarchaeota archaeon]|nr:hypothetical protein [Candidatus Heimdallarchaeota archaeon]